MTPQKTKFEEFVADFENRRLFEQEALVLEATELITQFMEKRGVNKTQLAKKIGRSKAFVTQILSGSRNMTLHTLADVAFALGCRIKLKGVPERQYRTHATTDYSFVMAGLVERTRGVVRPSFSQTKFVPSDRIREMPVPGHLPRNVSARSGGMLAA
jgi:transcriptional regulator with XRE-family HTH domain